MNCSILMFFKTLLCIIAVVHASSCGKDIEVSTTLGKVKGALLATRLGDSFYAFRGIRYAEPPIGELRFRNPQPVASWKPKIFDATADGPMCPQRTNNMSDVSEDCLRLNVYTKDIMGNKPVIVYIHPGGFYAVSGQSKFAGPQHLMDRDVVLVTMNYRLGTLGFLAAGSADAPGNAGLKDQVIALRWIQTHIRNFGGDPNSVTLLGYSAGSLSIGLHMLSPMSSGLFHRGIAMSASPLAQWEYNISDMKLAERQAKLLNCQSESKTQLVNCLKKKPMVDIVNTMSDMFEFGWNPILNWRPVIESDYGQERFLIEHPYKTILRGDFYKVPLITGITEFEFISGAYYALLNETHRKWFNEDFERYAPIAFLYERNTSRSKGVSDILRRKYLKNVELTLPGSLEAFGELYSDSVIGFEFHRFLQLVAPHTPVYTYLFTYKGRYSHFTYPGNQTYGAVHHDELLYLLYVPFLTPLFKESDPENQLIERLTRMWSEFAKTGNPNNPNDEYLSNVNWNLYSVQNKEFLEIGEELVPKTGGFYQERYKLWDELFPVPNPELL